MERMKHRPAEPTRSSRVHRTKRGRRLGAAMAVGAMVAVAMPVLSSVTSDAAVGGRRSIETTTVSDLTILAGYPRSARVRITVFRRGVVVGYATKRAFRGEIELNHGGGPDCWESPRTPNIRPGDRIQTRIIGTRIRDFTIVRGVTLTDVVPGATSITASGNVRLGTGRAAVNPDTDVLELRVRTASGDFREDIGTSVNRTTGSWTHQISGIPAEEVAGAEVVLEWSRGAAGDELTVAELGDPAARGLGLPGCPPVERN
jgi:hypothetical protein